MIPRRRSSPTSECLALAVLGSSLLMLSVAGAVALAMLLLMLPAVMAWSAITYVLRTWKGWRARSPSSYAKGS